MSQTQGTPEMVEEVWGVELDDMGSVDYYDSYDDALADCYKYGYRLVRVQTEWYTPEIYAGDAS